MRNIVSSVARFLGRIKSLPLRRTALFLMIVTGAVPFARAQGVPIPNFWDPKAQLERPELTGARTVRFLVDDDFPPLHFGGIDGNPTGFSVELARAACERLAMACTIQVRRFDMLLDALAEKQGDVIAAAIPLSASLRQRFTVTGPYFKIPARFAVRKDRNQPVPEGRALTGKTVGLVAGTAHEAFAKAFMPGAVLKDFPELPLAQAALKDGSIDYLFADGLGLALWIGGEEAAGCCDFSGGPYLESRFFGEGVGFILRMEDENLRRALDFALQQLWKEGKYAELYLRFFPVGLY